MDKEKAPMSEDHTETVAINNLSDFLDHFVTWHNKQIDTLNHISNIPEGGEVIIGDNETLIMSGDVRKAFQLGINLGVSYLGDLPFVAEVEDLNTEDASVH